MSTTYCPVTTALYGVQDMQSFFERAAASLAADDRASQPGACCLLDDDDEHPRGYVSIWAETAREGMGNG